MSERLRELAERQAALQLRCALQRRAVANEVEAIEARFDSIDRVARLTRSVLSNPGVIAVGVIALLTIGRIGGLHMLGRVVLLTQAARQLLRALKI